MAHHVEPMDVDSSVCDFDNKENTFHHSNVLPRTPCTEKGYEELDVSELNMKLRYSLTPASSPMSKSFTANCVDNRNFEFDNENTSENGNLTRSLHSVMTRNDSTLKSQKVLPLQVLPADQFVDGNRNAFRSLDCTATNDNNVTVTVTTNEIDENVSLPSSSSSMAHTPEATTPTKDIHKDGGSPILRGLKSVLNMFRPSQSPIPPAEDDNNAKVETLSPPVVHSPQTADSRPEAVLASTPLAARNTKDVLSKRNSPNRDSIVFNDDLEKELQWKDESTIIFSKEKIPIHKLFFQQGKLSETSGNSKNIVNEITNQEVENKLDCSVEYMDISYNDSLIKDKTITETEDVPNKSEINMAPESDSEFQDCESTFTKNNSQTECSFKSQEELSVKTKDDLLVDQNIQGNNEVLDLNATIESVSTIASSKADLSVASTETAKADDNAEFEKVPAPQKAGDVVKQEEFEIKEVPQGFGEGKNIDMPVTLPESHLLMSVENISDEPINVNLDVTKTFESKSTLIDDNVKLDLALESNSNIVLSDFNTVTDVPFVLKDNVDTVPTLENLVVNSLAQIPLIADPRVLLFSIPSEDPVNVEKVQQNVDLDTSPADIPLPDDDDIEKFVSLPIQEHCEVQIEPSPIHLISIDTNQLKSESVNLNSDVNVEPKLTESWDVENNFVTKMKVAENFVTENSFKETDTQFCVKDHDNEIKDEKTDSSRINIVDTVSSIEGIERAVVTVQEIASINMNENINHAQILPELNQADTNITTVIEHAVETNAIENKEEPLELPKTETNSKNASETSNKEMKQMNINSVFVEQNVANGTSSILEVETVPIENENKELEPKANIEFNFTNESKVNIENKTQIPSDFDHIKINSTAVIEQDVLCCTPISEVKAVPCESRQRTPELSKTGIELLSVTDHVYTEEKETGLEKIEAADLLSKDMVVKGSCPPTSGIANQALEMAVADIEKDSEKVPDLTKADNSHIAKQTKSIDVSGTENIADELTVFNIEATRQIPHIIAVDDRKPIDAPNVNLNETQTEIMDISYTNTSVLIGEDIINKTIEIVTTEESNITSMETNQNKDIDIINELAAIAVPSVAPDIFNDIPTIMSTDVTDNKDGANNNETHVIRDSIITKSDSLVTPTNDIATVSSFLHDDKKTEIVTEVSKADRIDNDENAIKEEQLSNMPSKEGIDNVKPKIEAMDEEIIASENSSPFVSVSADLELLETAPLENLEEIHDPFAKKTRIVVTPPVSPKIVSKGYNFNFDEIDDPFATKTKIRTSPPAGVTPNQSFEQVDDRSNAKDISKKDLNKNRRKSQPDRKRPAPTNKKMNCAFAGNSNTLAKATMKKCEDIKKPVLSEETKVDDLKNSEDVTNETTTPSAATPIQKSEFPENLNTTFDNKNTEVVNKDFEEVLNAPIEMSNAENEVTGTESTDISEENKSSVESVITLNETKTTSSSEQSTYYSAGTSSNEAIESRNVFNLPEIDDTNFNPFATKTKIRQSPPRSLDIDDSFATKSKIRSSPEPPKIIAENSETVNTTINLDSVKESKSVDIKDSNDKSGNESEEKDSSHDISSATCSSKATDDKDTTVREVHTEDEDTVEGPFLETEDLNDKMSDFDDNNVDMMQFSEIPAHANDENADGELFIDAEAFEFLLNQNKANTVADSGKESLFLKFDPLFAKRMSSDGVLAALNKVQKRQSTPKKASKPPQKDATFVEKSPIAGPSHLNVTQDIDMNNVTEESNDDLNVTVSKPMMVVNPAVNPVVTPRNKTMTPPRANRRSLTFTSPAIAVIDRLLSLSTNNSFVGQDTTLAEVNREPNETDLALTQLRELLADKEINVYNLRSESKELKDRLSALESQMKTLEAISEERLKKINELTEKLSEKTKINKSMATVVEEYERTIASLIAETEQDKKRHTEERIQLIKERDEQTAHLTSMEVSFSDLHSKYEKSKQVILGFKANEDFYKKSIKEFEENLAKMQNNYELLKQHATSKLNHANEELQKMNRTHEAEVVKLNAMIKRKELHITSLEETLLQKTKANEELTAICDELINKVG